MNTQERTLTTAAARKLTARIRDALALADDLLVKAYEGRAWEALGHASWSDYCAAELPELRMVRLSKNAQSKHFAELARRGFSTHATAAAYGVSQGTVRNRLKGVERPDTVLSRDGVRRPSQQPPRAAAPLPEPLTNWQVVTRFVGDRGAFGATCAEFEAEAGWSHGRASAAFHAAQRKGHVRRSGSFRRGYGAYVIAAR